MSTKRFAVTLYTDVDGAKIAKMVEHVGGQYVLATDYDELNAKLQRAQAQVAMADALNTRLAEVVATAEKTYTAARDEIARLLMRNQALAQAVQSSDGVLRVQRATEKYIDDLKRELRGALSVLEFATYHDGRYQQAITRTWREQASNSVHSIASVLGVRPFASFSVGGSEIANCDG